MIKDEEFMLLVAQSTHYVMKLEKDLQKNDFYCKIIPLPAEISAGCGMSIRYNMEDDEKITKLLQSELESDNVKKYFVVKKGFKKYIARK